MRENENNDLKVTVHDLHKYACSYSRQYFSSPKRELAKKVGSNSFPVIDNRYIRHVPKISVTYQVLLGTIYPTIIKCNTLRNINDKLVFGPKTLLGHFCLPPKSVSCRCWNLQILHKFKYM